MHRNGGVCQSPPASTLANTSVCLIPLHTLRSVVNTASVVVARGGRLGKCDVGIISEWLEV